MVVAPEVVVAERFSTCTTRLYESKFPQIQTRAEMCHVCLLAWLRVNIVFLNIDGILDIM